MYPSTASNLESRFKAMSIERDNYLDSRYSRSSAHASASPNTTTAWQRRGGPGYASQFASERGPLYPSSQPAYGDRSDWRSRSRDGFGGSARVERTAPLLWDAGQTNPSTAQRRGSDSTGKDRRHRHRSSADRDDDDYDDDYEDDRSRSSVSDDDDGEKRHSRTSRHRSSSSQKKKRKERDRDTRASSSHRRSDRARHRDPTYRRSPPQSRGHNRTEDSSTDESDMEDHLDTYPSESQHEVRYVGANNMPGSTRRSPPQAPPRPSIELPSQTLPAHTAGDGHPTSPQSTLLKLVEQQDNRLRGVSGGTSDSLWNVASPSAGPALPSAASRPSQLLEAIVHNIAFYRRCAPPDFIPPEVSLAFDEYLARGTSLLKFTKNGPPHHRFFSVRFLDLSHTKRLFERTSRTYGDRVEQQSLVSCGLPEAVFCYYSSAHSKVIRRYFPLADLVQVMGNGDGHPFVQRLMTRNGVLKVGRSGPFAKYTRADYILQFKFRSHVSMNEETIAVQAPDPTIYLAWQVVADFFSRVGDQPVAS